MDLSRWQTPCVLLLLLLLLQPVSPADYFVMPTGSSMEACPGNANNCLSLDDYCRNRSSPFALNETLYFLPGDHYFNHQLEIDFSKNIALVRYQLLDLTPVNIICNNSARFKSQNSIGITFENLNFYGCGSDAPYKAALTFDVIQDLTFRNVRIEGIPCNAISVTDLTGFLRISDSVFSNLTSSGPCNYLIQISLLNTPQDGTLINHIVIVDTTFSGGEGGSLDLQLQYGVNVQLDNITTSGSGETNPRGDINIESFSAYDVLIDICNSLISNSSSFGITLYDFFSTPGAVTLRNCEISGHTLGGVYNEHRAVIADDEGIGLSFEDCTFYHNGGSAIATYNSRFSVSGNMRFIENSAYEGAAMQFIGNSFMDIMDNTDILFQGNAARHVGGAINVININNLFANYGEVEVDCFFTLQGLLPSSMDLPLVHMSFINNTAINGGDAIFGASLDRCFVFAFLSLYGFELISTETEPVGEYGSIAHFEPNTESDSSLITSNPTRVCFCVGDRDTINCSSLVLQRSVHPGEDFTVSMVTVGDRLGTAAGSVHSQFLPFRKDESRVPSLEELQDSQSTTKTGCTDVQFTIISDNPWEVLAFTATGMAVLEIPDREGIDATIEDYENYNSGFHASAANEYLTLPVFVNITLLECPLGFTHKGGRCVCDADFEKHDITCNISDQTINRDGKLWVNAAYRDGVSVGVIVHENCPYRYCREESTNVDLQDPDSQCALGHSGTLCGGCQSGLSLALATSKCLPCTNSYLALLIPFALAGILLVLFLKVLNLTVAEGTINGLIFYANIVRANEATFFPEGDRSVFIAWLNLDLGIETCFFDGLTGYGKTWLQFIFPLYICVIAFTMILAAHRSSTVSRFFGTNSVPLLSTLFLLSYTKVLRTVITILSVSYIDNPDGSTNAVWSYDGNIEYGDGKHTPLLLVAIAVIIILWFPYTVGLLAPRVIPRLTKYSGFHWMTRLKPFLDAYIGPLKDKHSYWVGILLLVRTLVLLTSAASQGDSIRLLAIGVSSVLLLAYTSVTGHLYKSWFISLLENSFFTNLLVLVIATYFTLLHGGSQAAVAYTSVAFAFLEFVAITILHVFKAVGRTEVGEKAIAKITARWTRTRPQEEKGGRVDDAVVPHRHTSVNIRVLQAEEDTSEYDTELREPVLDFDNGTGL